MGRAWIIGGIFAGGICLFALLQCAKAPQPQFVPNEAEALTTPILPISNLEAHNSKDDCVQGVDPNPDRLTLTATPLPLDPTGAMDIADYLAGLEYMGGFHINPTTDDPRWGGLSGLKLSPNGKALIAVSDAGHMFGFHRPKLKPQIQSLNGFALNLRDRAGIMFERKIDADAEGLEIIGDYALISFERDHRISAFNIAECGAAAKAIPLASLPHFLPKSLHGGQIGKNGGPEALVNLGSQLAVGIERLFTKMPDQTGLLFVHEGGAFSPATPSIETNVRLVGADRADDGALYTLHREYSPVKGNTIEIYEHRKTGVQRLARLERPLNVDNFEGIAVANESGGVRTLYIISDDNYSSRQRSLLFVFNRAY